MFSIAQMINCEWFASRRKNKEQNENILSIIQYIPGGKNNSRTKREQIGGIDFDGVRYRKNSLGNETG